MVGQANPEREAVRLGDELHMRAVLDVVDARQVASTLTARFQSLVPTQFAGHHLVT